MKQKLIGLMGGALIAAAAQGQVLVNFESFPPGVFFAPGTPVTAANQLSDQLGGIGVHFASATRPYVALVDLSTYSPTHAPSGVNGIGAVTDSDTLVYGLISIEFRMPGTAIPAATDSVSIRFDTVPTLGDVQMQAFDYAGSLLATATVPDVAGSISLAVGNIHRVQLTQSSATVGFDDLQFNTLTPVPEPETYSMIFALGSLAALVVKRRIGATR